MTLMLLRQVLSAEEIGQLRALAAESDDTDAAFVDGGGTAGYAAKLVKKNLQMASGPRLDAARRIIEPALARHDPFQAGALPKRLVGVMVSLYREGMEYGAHVDDAIMSGVRNDLSFTIFLNPPESYEGGELVITDQSAETPVKLPAGDAVLYSTGALHRVAPVKRGERLCAVGWVRSMVRRPDQRELLMNLASAQKRIFDQEGKTALYDMVAKSRANLLRMWAED